MAMDLNPDLLQLAHCPACGAYTFPATAPGCRVCGAAPDTLHAVPLPGTPVLQNFVTVHAALAPGLPVPCVIGEVLLAPGVVEEALIAVADASVLAPGQPLVAQRWLAAGAVATAASAASLADTDQPLAEASPPARWQFAPLPMSAAAFPAAASAAPAALPGAATGAAA